MRNEVLVGALRLADVGACGSYGVLEVEVGPFPKTVRLAVANRSLRENVLRLLNTSLSSQNFEYSVRFSTHERGVAWEKFPKANFFWGDFSLQPRPEREERNGIFGRKTTATREGKFRRIKQKRPEISPDRRLA